jgi:DNA-binding response OmpR family regulator
MRPPRSLYFAFFGGFPLLGNLPLGHHEALKGATQMAQEKHNILVVDDNQDVRDLVVHILSADGFHVYAAVDGENALAILNSNKIDLVLLDVMMPGMSGLDVLNEIRNGSNKKVRDIPVMMITAKSSTEDIDKALAIGANSYVVKPFRGTTIREKVRTILELPFNG